MYRNKQDVRLKQP